MAIQPSRIQSNNMLIFFITSIFMVLIAFLAFSFVTSSDNFDKIKQNQQTGQQSRNSQNANLLSVTCSLWSTMISSPSVKPSPSTVQQMHELCG